ncbi:follistatin-related protein, partial [Elysia marginata]
FCQGDFECRAGRTCQQGMCKCVPLSWCDHSVAVEEGFLATEDSDISYLPVCGTDGNRYRSHCHLHRTACVSRNHIRVDRHGAACLRSKKSGQTKEEPVHVQAKSWLMEQERLLQENEKKQEQLLEKNSPKMMADQPSKEHLDTAIGQNKVVIPEHDIVHFPVKAEKDEITSSVKKDGLNLETLDLTSEESLRTIHPKEKCTWSQMNEFKDALLLFYCHKFVEPNCPLEVKTERQYLSMLMYSYYDKDFDYFLTAEELDDKERDEHFDNHTVRNCHLHDFVKFADTVGTPDGKLTITEFSKAFEITNPTQQPDTKVEVISTLASAGNGLELKCGIQSNAIIWKKQGAQLSDDKRSHQLMVFDDGALFFSKVGLHHVGNYTCMDAEDPSTSQIHRLRVQTMPKVTVNPITQTHSSGLDIELRCHAEGVPKPTLYWSKGERPLHSSERTAFYFDGGHVVIHDASPEKDAGTYTCTAHNQAGTTHKSVSVSVLAKDAPLSKDTIKEAGTFVVFHPHGITAYDPMHCTMKHKVNGMFGNFKFIPDAMEEPLTLCKPDSDCKWGSAVRVGKDFIYASQPDQNRVLVMQASGSWLPLQVIDTDASPSQMWYVKHLDQVWVLCQGKQGSEGTNIIVVIRDASQHIQHRSVHTRPVGNHFDMVQDLFIAPPNDLDHEFDYGYVSHKGQKGLFKINLEDMSYTKAVDLSSYGCVPSHVAFVPIGGHIVVHCVSASDQHSLQLVLDYLTDTVTSTISLTGQPMTSPDSRHLITVDKLSGRVTVASISEEGVMATTYEVTVSASISDVAFMPAATHPGYDLILTSADDDDVIIMNLVTGKVEKISGSKYSSSSQAWHPSAVKRRIATADTLSSFLMAPAMSSLDILDITFRQVECEFSNSESDVIIHVPSWQTS